MVILDPLDQVQVTIVLTFRFQSTPGYDQMLVLAWHRASGPWGHLSTTYNQRDVQFQPVLWLGCWKDRPRLKAVQKMGHLFRVRWGGERYDQRPAVVREGGTAKNPQVSSRTHVRMSGRSSLLWGRGRKPPHLPWWMLRSVVLGH